MRLPDTLAPAAAAAIAAHRFGLGEPDLAIVVPDARRWLLGQIGAADTQRGTALAGLTEALARQAAARPADARAAKADLQAQVQADMRARLLTAATSRRPFAERLALFWCNHFTVSLGKASSQGLVGAFEREAIRPHIAGRLGDLLQAAVTHPAMLRYLDNHLSAGPQSTLVQRLRRRSVAAVTAGQPAENPPRLTGLNENLAREVLELHTLGVTGGGGAYGPWGGYSQADVTSLAAVLTGWRGPRPAAAAGQARAEAASGPDNRPDAFPTPPHNDPPDFDPAWHQPGPKTLLGRTYPAGAQALPAVLADLARQPAMHRHVATQLARHFVADQPAPALVTRLANSLQTTDGDLTALYQVLIDAPEAWSPAPDKLKTPEAFVLSSARLLGLGERLTQRAADAGLAALGQRPQSASSPAGWSDLAADWLGPEAVWQRVEWAVQWAERLGASVDARALASSSLGPMLSEATRQQIERAADGPQAVTLLLMAPEFQRR